MFEPPSQSKSWNAPTKKVVRIIFVSVVAFTINIEITKVSLVSMSLFVLIHLVLISIRFAKVF